MTTRIDSTAVPARAPLGHEPRTGIYFERLGPERVSGPSLLMIHGAGATGACWRATPDGRLGWADQLAADGYDVWVTDWPGTGRSGNRNGLEIGFADVVVAYRTLLREVIGRPCLVMCHSMGGAVTWQLVEHESDLVIGVLSVAGAYPGNLVAASEVLDDDGVVARVAFADTGVALSIDRRVMNLYGDSYIYDQGIAGSTRFPRHLVDQLRASLVGVPPTMLLERLGVREGLPRVADPTGFVGKPVVLLAGDQDPAHTHEIESRTAAQLCSWGADARLAWLPEEGIDGNGHFPFLEENSDEVLGVVRRLLGELGGVAADIGESSP